MYHHLGCTSFSWLMSYPFRSLNLNSENIYFSHLIFGISISETDGRSSFEVAGRVPAAVRPLVLRPLGGRYICSADPLEEPVSSLLLCCLKTRR